MTAVKATLDLVVWDGEEACAYLPNERARLPHRYPIEPVQPAAFDALLELGDRRAGVLLYRPSCPSCSACEAIRIPVAEHVPTRSQRRAWKRNDGELVVEIARPEVTPRHVELFNRHKDERGLSRREGLASPEEYRAFLVDSCVPAREIRYLLEGKLVAVSILDFGERSVSSVYHYFDPDVADRSIGVYSVLKEIELTRELGLDWYYLGLYVEGCRALRYKAGYFPHERRIGGTWRRFTGDARDARDDAAVEPRPPEPPPPERRGG